MDRDYRFDIARILCMAFIVAYVHCYGYIYNVISPFDNFSGVDIRGSKFSKNNDKSIEGMNSSFSRAIYDENTTFEGIPFTEIYGECQYKKGRKI